MAINKIAKKWIGPSNSEQFLQNRSVIPQVSALMANDVSHVRKEILSNEVSEGLFRDGSSSPNKNNGLTYHSHVTSSSSGFKKNAQIVSSSGNYSGSGGTVKQMPEVYSPLWLNSNLNLPRDRATINAWCRSFFALNPFVHNAISLHSTYPISKLNIKCPNKDIEKFFNDMIEEIDLMNVCVQIAQEYWLLGEAFVYAELDENRGKWSRLVINNPDYMIVKRTVMADEPVIMLRPDENLKKIIFSNRPGDIEQRKQLNNQIIDSVKRGENIQLDNFNVTHLAKKISPYEIRGTGLPVCIFRQLMLFDRLRESKFAQADSMINPVTLVKIGGDGPENLHPTFADIEAWRDVFECHDEDTEILTKNGFKKFNEVISYEENNGIISNIKPKQDIEIACFNSSNEKLEYHEPLNASLYNYNGDMYHFSNKKIDIKVTPNHKMWISNKGYEYNGHRSRRKSIWHEWKKIEAKDISLSDYSRFRSQLKWDGKDNIEFIDVCGKQVPVELYLEFLGYLLSEGCLYTDNKSQYTVGICQTFKKYQKEMFECIEKFTKCLGKTFSSKVNKIQERCPNSKNSNIWEGIISGKELYNFFKKEVGNINGETKAQYKHIPKNILDFSPRLLEILLQALVYGDGSIVKHNDKTKELYYYTTSKQLANDIYEIVFKCGYAPLLSIKDKENYTNRKDHKRLPLYIISWSTTNNGNFPLVYKTYRNSKTKEKHNILKLEKYNGKVWCFEVPTGLFVTRRNGKITIQGNSAAADKDFKIFTHSGVSIEKIGSGSGIYDISGDITQLIKEIYIGLEVPSVIMDGGSGDVSYANGGVSLDVLRQRYMQFRNMMSVFLRRKIFAPISKIQGFYDYSDGEKQLIVPEVDWNHMSLFDAGDYINTLVTLTQVQGQDPPRAALHTLHRSLGLETEDENRKIRKEAIQAAISRKERMALDALDLLSLRALDDEDEIPEPTKPAGEAGTSEVVPGQVPSPGGLDFGTGGLSSPMPSLSPPMGPPSGGASSTAPSTSPAPAPGPAPTA